ncbi:MAG TPA: hypothetical protein DD420_35000 [Streptomyces sp.]|nr:hypothetical protein [Streptomyces sp.]
MNTPHQEPLDLGLEAPPTSPPPRKTRRPTPAPSDAPSPGDILAQARALFARLDELDPELRIDTINALRLDLHAHSPLRDQPVDCVLWVRADQVDANDYNPNAVAPPEMDLLRLSIKANGFTQPVVTWQPDPQDSGPRETADPTGSYEVVDGFHRNRVGKEDTDVRASVHGRLPVTVINPGRTDRADRMAATIRHNRARGQHTVDKMSDMVIELARRGKSDDWIGRELGLDQDEVRRLRQVAGLAEVFADEAFSEAWEIAGETR